MAEIVFFEGCRLMNICLRGVCGPWGIVCSPPRGKLRQGC